MTALPVPPEIYFSDFAFDTYNGSKALLKAYVVATL